MRYIFIDESGSSSKNIGGDWFFVALVMFDSLKAEIKAVGIRVKITEVNSKKNNLIQIADYVVSSKARNS